VAFGLPKRPTRPKGRAASNIDKENDEAFEIPQVTKEIDNEQEIGSFPWYEDSEDEPIDDEPVEFLEAEGRKRPKRPTNINYLALCPVSNQQINFQLLLKGIER